MKDTLKIVFLKEMERITGRMVENMLDNLKMINLVDLELELMKLKVYLTGMKEPLKMTIMKEMEHFTGKMVKDMLDSLKMVKRMDLEF
jgi:hypothetical protein